MLTPGAPNALFIGAATQSTGYQIARSLRFRAANSNYANRTAGVATDTKKKTLSVWIKRSLLSSEQHIISAYNGSGGQDGLYITAGDQISVYATNGGAGGQTTPVRRDPGAFGHLVYNLDTTQAVAADRIKVWWNGVLQENSFSAPTLNATNDKLLNNQAFNIGRDMFGSTRYFDGYMTELVLCDGYCYDPTYFAETSATTGQWAPKQISGVSYGAQGGYYPMTDNSSVANLGTDSSGNGNTLTMNNFSVTAGTTNDSLVDSPTNYSSDTGAGGEVRGNYCTWNALEYYSNAPTDGNLGAYSATSNSNQVSNWALPTSGKWFWEVTRTETDGTSAYSWMVGVVKADTNKAVTTYTSANAYVYYSWDGSKYTAGVNAAYGSNWRTSGDVIGCYWDADAQTLTFYKNGVSQGTAFTSLNNAGGYMIIASRTGGASASTLYLNAGQRPWAYSPPAGAKALCTQNLSTAAIYKGNLYFDIKTRTGTGASATQTGLLFQPDLIWTKSRSNATNNNVFDVLRGVQKGYVTNGASPAAEYSDANTLTAFTSDGYTYGSDGSSRGVNINTNTYVDWLWKANGAGSSNTSGSITSTVSVNTTAGIAILKYTGNGTGGATIGHGLGAVPKFGWLWEYATGGGSFLVYHASDNASPQNGYMQLNNINSFTSSSTSFNNTAPTSTLITLGTSSSVNASGGSHIGVWFAEVAGFSKFGSYAGNGLSGVSAPFVYLGFRPRFVLIKCYSANGSWTIWDSARNTYNVETNYLLAEAASAEATGATYLIDFCSNGFQIRGAAGDINGGNSYLFAAFAEQPINISRAR